MENEVKDLKELVKAQEITINNLSKMIVSLQKDRKDLVNESFEMYNKLSKIEEIVN